MKSLRQIAYISEIKVLFISIHTRCHSKGMMNISTGLAIYLDKCLDACLDKLKKLFRNYPI